MHYFSNFKTKFFKLFATGLIATGRHVAVGQPRYWLQSAVNQIMTLVLLNFSDKAPKIVTFKLQILSLLFTILWYFEFFFMLLWYTSLFENEISWSCSDVVSTYNFWQQILVKKCKETFKYHMMPRDGVSLNHHIRGRGFGQIVI